MHGSTRLAGACAVEWFETGMQVRQDQLIKIEDCAFLTGHALFGFFANLQRLMSFCFERRVVFKMSPKVISCIHALTWAGGSNGRDDREARLESSPDGQCVQGGRRMAAQRCT